jgi:hypothetical protein
MRWVIVAIVGFIALYSFVTFNFRKENAPSNPYEAAQLRGGHALRDVGWRPFPNAYWLPGTESVDPRLQGLLEETPFEVLSRDDPRVRTWSGQLPALEQGEQLARIDAPQVLAAGSPYIARLYWDAPENFRPTQLIAFRRERSILIVPRPPERFAGGTPEQTIFIIPHEFIETGAYDVFLSTEGVVNHWTFEAK